MQRNSKRLVLTTLISIILMLGGLRATVIIQPVNLPQVADPGGGSGTGGISKTGVVS